MLDVLEQATEIRGLIIDLFDWHMRANKNRRSRPHENPNHERPMTMTDKITIAGLKVEIVEASGEYGYFLKNGHDTIGTNGKWNHWSDGMKLFPTREAAGQYIIAHADPPASAEVVEVSPTRALLQQIIDKNAARFGSYTNREAGVLASNAYDRLLDNLPEMAKAALDAELPAKSPRQAVIDELVAALEARVRCFDSLKIPYQDPLREATLEYHGKRLEKSRAAISKAKSLTSPPATVRNGEGA